MTGQGSRARPPEAFSIVIPALNEAGNLPGLIEEIGALYAGQPFELVVVDDGSTDGSGELLARLARENDWLRVVTHPVSAGQSAAIWDGVKAARHPVIATLDGDGQNAPADIAPMLLRLAAGPDIGMVCGQRMNRRVDGPVKLMSSRIANRIRSAVLGDGIRDAGCGLKVFRREDFLDLPYFGTMHRFLPALFGALGVGIDTYDVQTRPRKAGRSHYGTWARMWTGLVDLAGVYWLVTRRRSQARLRNTEARR